MTNVKIKVVEVVAVKGLALISCDLLADEDVVIGLRLARDDGSRWELINMARVKPELHQKGRRGLTLRPSTGATELKPGDILYSNG